MHSKRDLLRTALVYDFDGTLAPGNIQEHGLIGDYLGSTAQEFWRIVAERKKVHDADEILVYMQLILELAKQRSRPITREVLRAHGAQTPFFAGVVEWFARINQHAAERGLALEHYVISSGNEEIIQGTRIASEFEKIFACRYQYNREDEAEWPAVTINYTSKTQRP